MVRIYKRRHFSRPCGGLTSRLFCQLLLFFTRRKRQKAAFMANHYAWLSSFKASLPFAAFTFWLLAFPMAGPLQDPDRLTNPLLAFLVPHILTLLLLAFRFPEKQRHLSGITCGCCLLAAAAPLLYWLSPSLSVPALLLAGIGGGGFAVRSGALLAQANKTGRSGLLVTGDGKPDAAGADQPACGICRQIVPDCRNSLWRPCYLPCPPQKIGKSATAVELSSLCSALPCCFRTSLRLPVATLSAESLVERLGTLHLLPVHYHGNGPCSPASQTVVLFAGFACAPDDLLVHLCPGGSRGQPGDVDGSGGSRIHRLVPGCSTRHASQSWTVFRLGLRRIMFGGSGRSFFRRTVWRSISFPGFFGEHRAEPCSPRALYFQTPPYLWRVIPKNEQTGCLVPPEIYQLLSERENEVLGCVLQGHPYREVAEEMNISEVDGQNIHEPDLSGKPKLGEKKRC